MAPARLIIEGETTPEFRIGGALNMAIDEALLYSAAEDGTTTLRFYGWSPATLSLGYFQHHRDRDAHIASRDCHWVRRASGGGAIVHDNELTYSFALPSRTRFGETNEYYLAFHETLVELLLQRQVKTGLHSAVPGTSDAGEDVAFLCFQRRAQNDVILSTDTGNHKICGSAQRRWKNGLLQHGSVLLAQSEYAPELPGLRELSGFDLSEGSLIQVWLEKLGSRLNLEFRPTTMTDKESIRTRQILVEKFSADGWNQRR